MHQVTIPEVEVFDSGSSDALLEHRILRVLTDDIHHEDVALLTVRVAIHSERNFLRRRSIHLLSVGYEDVAAVTVHTVHRNTRAQPLGAIHLDVRILGTILEVDCSRFRLHLYSMIVREHVQHKACGDVTEVIVKGQVVTRVDGIVGDVHFSYPFF